ncbi:MAG TPA: orotidine-5'-phosphate decarboxylase [Actinomycetota bacterium]
MTNPLIVALDVPTVEEASALAKRIGDAAGAFKIGLELFGAYGPESVRAVDGPVFLDLKLHDIPTTVHRAMQSIAPLAPAMITVHALGGRAMLEAAASAKPSGTILLGVTVLTSMSDQDLFEVGLPPAGEAVPALASLAHEAGCDGIVCAPADLIRVREMLPKPFIVVTPGVRPAGADRDDQARAMTPARAIEAGADYLVVGRPITRASDPRAAAESIVAEASQ